MRAIQIVLGEELLRAADQVARDQRVSRSALVRQALREHLHRVAVWEREGRDRAGYEANPVKPEEFEAWDKFLKLR